MLQMEDSCIKFYNRQLKNKDWQHIFAKEWIKKKKKTHRSFAMQKENAGNIDFLINQKEKAERNKNRIKKFLFVFLFIYYNYT